MHSEVGHNEAPSGERVPRIYRGWYAAATTDEIQGTTLRAVRIYDREFVVYRGVSGRPVALVDRCPHRNVPLSLGKLSKCGELECKYHGWTFAEDGTLTRVPGRVAPCEKANAISVPTHEERGLVWIWPSFDAPPSEGPTLPPCHGEPGYTTLVKRVTAPASLYRTAENALDVPHTSVLHRGLFRSGERQRVTVTVRRNGHSAEAEYSGERPPRGLMSRVLGAGAKERELGLAVQHWDRFILPATVQVEYRLGTSTHFVVTAYCLPRDAEHTELLAVATFRTPLPGRLVAAVLFPVARFVFEQDRKVLGAQSRAFRDNVPEYHSSELDALGQEIWRLLLRASRREKEGSDLAAAEAREGTIVQTFELLA